MPPSVALYYDKHAQETTIRELAPTLPPESKD